jgi:hypothetical protein
MGGAETISLRREYARWLITGTDDFDDGGGGGGHNDDDDNFNIREMNLDRS